jgi:hypothetical protein
MAEENDEKSDKAKWANEAYALLSLFRKLRRRPSGLLMLELGWGLLVRFVEPLLKQKASRP